MPTTSIILIILGVLAFIFILKLTFSLIRFKDDLKYINMEIRRCDGEDRRHWKKRRRELWLSLISFW